MDAALAEPVLIIKAAWGGKSLHTDFRPPSAGPYVLNEFQKKLYYGPKGHGVPEDMNQWLAEKKREQVSQMRWYLDVKHKDHANADGKMTEEQKREFVEKFEADLITPAEAVLWKRGASNAGYHYLGCAKTFALMGQAFAQATLHMMQERQGP
jgi:alpha-galactosidase